MEGELKYSFIENGDFIVFEDGRIFKRLDPPVSSGRYKYVRVGKKSYPLHRVIASVFVPNPENKQEVNHIDGNKTKIVEVIGTFCGEPVGISKYDGTTWYYPGDVVEVEDFDYSDEECSTGFHFFCTRGQAEAY